MLIDNEAVADILSNKLGDQEFNTLNMKIPTVAKKIYNWIIDKLNRITNFIWYRSEILFWKYVKNKFENAYRQEYQGNINVNTKYSIQTDNKENKNIRVDTDQNIF